MYHWQRLETPAGCLYVQAPRCLSFTLIGWAVVAKWRLFGGDDERYDSWRHHERSPRTPIFIPGRKTKQSRRIGRFLVAIDPPNRKSSPPDGDDFPLWCNKLWGAGGERLGSLSAGLVSVYGVANHMLTENLTLKSRFQGKFLPREYCQATLPYAWKKTYQETGVGPMNHVLYLPVSPSWDFVPSPIFCMSDKL
jgi:hypothetical protein